MGNVISEIGDHRQQLRKLLTTTQGSVRIASAYVTDTDPLLDATARKIQLLTAITTMDIVFGATSLDSLATLIDRGVECRVLPTPPRLHAKVYIFGEESALVTSANLTSRALDSNIEVGVQVSGSTVHELANWFDERWNTAEPLDLVRIAQERQRTAALREEFSILRAQCRLLDRPGARPAVAMKKKVPTLTDSSVPYFLCNTNRKWSKQLPSGEYDQEQMMMARRYATAWEDFKHTSHMEEVRRGNIILMYANGVGIIGIGKARDRCERLEPGSPGRVVDGDTPEWRIPVDWLVWVDDKHACPWDSPLPPTFQDVCGARDSDRRKAVIKHFPEIVPDLGG